MVETLLSLEVLIARIPLLVVLILLRTKTALSKNKKTGTGEKIKFKAGSPV